MIQLSLLACFVDFCCSFLIITHRCHNHRMEFRSALINLIFSRLPCPLQFVRHVPSNIHTAPCLATTSLPPLSTSLSTLSPVRIPSSDIIARTAKVAAISAKQRAVWRFLRHFADYLEFPAVERKKKVFHKHKMSGRGCFNCGACAWCFVLSVVSSA